MTANRDMPASQGAIPLTTLPPLSSTPATPFSQSSTSPLSPTSSIAALPPPDRGRQAYLFLAACFILEATTWGFPLSFGVFQTYYASTPPFSADAAGIPAIATTATGLMYLGSPAVAYVIARWPRLRVPCFWTGFVLSVAALLGASWATSTPQLLALQGVLYALGGLILYFPAMPLVDEWFVQRKSFAYGVIWAGAGSSGAVVPFLMQWLLDRYGSGTALRVWTVIYSALIIPSLLVIKPRLPPSPANRVRPVDWSFLKTTTFWVYEAGVIFQGLGFFLPLLYLPSCAKSFGFPSYAGPLAVALYCTLGSLSSVLIGFLCDRYHVTTAILIATLGSTVATFVFWGLASSEPMFYLFAISWGLFAGGYSTTWSGCANSLRQSGFQNLDFSSVLSLMAAGKGIGAIVSGPLSSRLLALGPLPNDSAFVYGTEYGNLVIFTGIAALMGGTAWAGRQLKVL